MLWCAPDQKWLLGVEVRNEQMVSKREGRLVNSDSGGEEEEEEEEEEVVVVVVEGKQRSYSRSVDGR